MSTPVSKIQKHYSYKDYKDLPTDKKYEILNGVLYNLAPSPSTQHQRILGDLFVSIKTHLKESRCEVFCAPYDVLLPDADEDAESTKTVVQPDIMVICDKSKLTEKNCIGAPELIIEIVSPSAPSMDYVKKLQLYEKHKVREYWIVNYLRQDIMVYQLQKNGEYNAPETYSNGEITSGTFQNIKIHMEGIFS
ncbi:MAG: Uma2 family endonuclease [Firmicutes bacterium]|nr:Uma2 family endonuclease [Bacillota bacterium]